MEETSSYPPIEPTNFDLIVVGTGLPESVIAAAASFAGKSVLHLDPNSFYGSHYASVPLHELTSFLHSHSQSESQPYSPSSAPSDGSDFTYVPLHTRPMYSDVEISSYSDQILDQSRKFNVDLAGPRVLFCADSAIELMMKSGTSQYMEFKSIDESLFFGGDGKLWTVPDSRKAIFKDRSLGFAEKNQLMKFFKLVQAHLEEVNSGGGSGGDDEAESVENKRIAVEDLESPFVEFLSKMNLPPKLKSVILYAIAMADYDQDGGQTCKHVVKTKEGIDRLALYQSSIGRFHNAPGALIYPLYGQGELPQAYCRRAAVKGCTHVLRMPVVALLMEKGSENYKGVKLASGQELLSHQLVLDPSFAVKLPSANSPSDFLPNSFPAFGLQSVDGKVARGICITKDSLKPDVSNCLVFFPPRSLNPEQVTSVRVLQLGCELAVCPPGTFLIYLSSMCDDAVQGTKSIHAAIDTLFHFPSTGSSKNICTEHSSENSEVKPTLLWSALYLQQLSTGTLGSITTTSMPDGNLQYHHLFDHVTKLFHRMYPDDEFFPSSALSDQFEVDDGPDVEPLE